MHIVDEKEAGMPRVEADVETTLSPERVREALLDFSDRRPEIWTGLAGEMDEVYSVGETSADGRGGGARMCRKIKPPPNFEPPATDDEVRAAALQYVRKVSGTQKPSKANEAAFTRAVDEIAHITGHLLAELVTTAPPRDREVEAARARERAAKRFGRAA